MMCSRAVLARSRRVSFYSTLRPWTAVGPSTRAPAGIGEGAVDFFYPFVISLLSWPRAGSAARILLFRSL